MSKQDRYGSSSSLQDYLTSSINETTGYLLAGVFLSIDQQDESKCNDRIHAAGTFLLSCYIVGRSRDSICPASLFAGMSLRAHGASNERVNSILSYINKPDSLRAVSSLSFVRYSAPNAGIFANHSARYINHYKFAGYVLDHFQ
jgi:hypothetical protein